MNIPTLPKNTVRDALLGFAIGDAYGVPYEFLSRVEIARLELGDMVGRDTSPAFESRWIDMIPAGAWSDDTSMLIAAMDGIIAEEGHIVDTDIMDRFVAWWDEGQFCSLDFPFGLGGNVSKALVKYRCDFPPEQCGGTGFMDNGNGALMRILPFSLYAIGRSLDFNEMLHVVHEGSALTHAHEISKVCCVLYTVFLKGCITTGDVAIALRQMQEVEWAKHYSKGTLEAVKVVLDPDFPNIPISQIAETGYVVDSLEAALYSILHSYDYRTAIQTAVRLGYDTDTNAGITGSLAGILYGIDSIPHEWLSVLKRRSYLEEMASMFENTLNQLA